MFRNTYEQLNRAIKEDTTAPVLISGGLAVGKTSAAISWGKETFDMVFYISFASDINSLSAINIISNNKDLDSLRILVRQRRKILNAFRQSDDPNLAIDLAHSLLMARLMEKGAIATKDTNVLIVLDNLDNIPQVFSRLANINSRQNVKILGICGSFEFSLKNLTYYRRKTGLRTEAILKEKERSSTSSVSLIKMLPLTFSEWLLAMHLNEKEMIHEEIMAKLGEYMLVGGLPEAVLAWRNTGDISIVRQVQKTTLNRAISSIKACLSFVHHTKVDEIINEVPRQITQKFMLSKINKNIRAREYFAPLDMLEKHFFLHKIHKTNKLKSPLVSGKVENSYKLYPYDVGILAYILDKSENETTAENQISTNAYSYLFEQVVLMELVSQTGETPYSYASDSGKAKLPFLFQIGPEIIPVEVNPDSNTKKKSLWVYYENEKPRLAIRIHSKESLRQGVLLEIPPYEIGNL